MRDIIIHITSVAIALRQIGKSPWFCDGLSRKPLEAGIWPADLAESSDFIVESSCEGFFNFENCADRDAKS